MRSAYQVLASREMGSGAPPAAQPVVTIPGGPTSGEDPEDDVDMFGLLSLFGSLDIQEVQEVQEIPDWQGPEA